MRNLPESGEAGAPALRRLRTDSVLAVDEPTKAPAGGGSPNDSPLTPQSTLLRPLNPSGNIHLTSTGQEGFYSNRTDFIRTAIRDQLERHADVVRQSTARKSLDLGLRNYTREDLEAARRAGEMLQINVLGLATIAQDVTPELARATIASVSVLEALRATPVVKAALGKVAIAIEGASCWRALLERPSTGGSMMATWVRHGATPWCYTVIFRRLENA